MLPAAQREALIGEKLFSQSRWTEALAHFLEAARLQPNFGYFYFEAAMCNWTIGKLEDAGKYLEQAVHLDPKLGVAHAWLGEWYMVDGIIEKALQATAAAMAVAPGNVQCVLSRAWVLEAAGDLDGAWDLVQRLVTAGQMNASVARLYGRLASRFGQETQALAAIEQLMAAGQAQTDRVLHLTAAQLLESKGRYDEAFAHAKIAHAAHREAGYDPATQERWTGQVIAYFTRKRMLSLPKATVRCEKPVFIVGMPRSGTSLVEQILASHPAVYGAGELDFVNRIFFGLLDMLRANIADFPECLDRLTTAHLDGLAEVYLLPLNAFDPHAARITDKMPLNFLHLGLIGMLFPDARIIRCIRDPMDTCLSCFMTSFAQGNEFTHDLAHLGHFYRQHERLMAHWQSVIDLPILDVYYEQMITDQEGQSRRMIEFLGLRWDERCLRFYETKRACMTASMVQIRKPVYQTSLQRWRHYEKHLGPLRAALAGN